MALDSHRRTGAVRLVCISQPDIWIVIGRNMRNWPAIDDGFSLGQKRDEVGPRKTSAADRGLEHWFDHIDVRQPNEQEVSMLPGAIPHNVFLKNPGKYSEYTKVGYCTIGYRSSRFTQAMKQNGVTIYNLHGGMLGWVHDGGKIYDKNGQSFRIHVYGRPWELAPEGYQEVW